MPHNVVVLLLGYAGSGKLTIAQHLAARIDARIVDNHWINNPILALLDSAADIDPLVWDETDKVRGAVMETIARYVPAGLSFIFTYCAFEGDADDLRSYQLMRTTAERRAAVFVPVRILCSEEELVRRVVTPERAKRLKSTSAARAIAERRARAVLDPRHPDQLTLDVSALSAAESAAAIERHVCAVSQRDRSR